MHSFHLKNETETDVLGRKIAQILRPGLVVYLVGDLGAGKTSLARSMLRGLGFEGKVKSPSYALVELYTTSGLNLYHFDLYRFNDPEEWIEAGFREYFNPESICLIEWPEKGGDLIPKADIEIHLRAEGGGRNAQIFSETEAGINCLKKLA